MKIIKTSEFTGPVLAPRYYRVDGVRGFWIPGNAVAGASDTGMAPDSPCPSNKVKAESQRFQRECLQPAGIKSHIVLGASSNVFCSKCWVCVSEEDHPRAMELAEKWFADNRHSTDYIHDAKGRA